MDIELVYQAPPDVSPHMKPADWPTFREMLPDRSITASERTLWASLVAGDAVRMQVGAWERLYRVRERDVLYGARNQESERRIHRLTVYLDVFGQEHTGPAGPDGHHGGSLAWEGRASITAKAGPLT